MGDYDFDIPVTFQHRIRFTKDAFAPGNQMVSDLLETERERKVIVFIETEIDRLFPDLQEQIRSYLAEQNNLVLTEIVIMDGGEDCKISKTQIMKGIVPIERNGIDRHSYVFCIGGGAFLDVIGLSAATAHRGLRLVRFPTTTLAQDDSGVGVKNGINAFGKKNFIGTFAVPYAVVNDFQFLYTQDEHNNRSGLAEAVKVALVKDGPFFDWLEANVGALNALDPPILEEAVERSAILHASHIALGGDPFETGSSRPLDFGHWTAHKMEQLTNFELSHADAVSVGVALDTLYSARCGWLPEEDAWRVVRVLQGMQLPIWHESLEIRDDQGKRLIYGGLEEFREHLGGELTVLMLEAVGRGVDRHSVDEEKYEACMEELKEAALVAVSG